MTSTLQRLQEWYADHCERVPWEGPGIDPSLPWEELFGVRIETLDNPGWVVEVDLTDTDLESTPFERYEDMMEEPEWLACWRDDRSSHSEARAVFKATCGPTRLENALEVFLDWAEGATSEP